MALRPDPKYVATRPGSGGGSQVLAPVPRPAPEFDLSEPSLEEEDEVALPAAPVAVRVSMEAAPVRRPEPPVAAREVERPAPPTEVLAPVVRGQPRRVLKRRGPLVLGLTLCGLALVGAPLVYLLAQRRAETGQPLTRARVPGGDERSPLLRPTAQEDLAPRQQDEARPARRRPERTVRSRLARRHHGLGPPAQQVLAAGPLPGPPLFRLTPEQLRGVMVRSQPQLHRCLQEGWGSDVTIGVTVRPSGQVERVEIMNALSGRPTGRCLEGRIRALRFPAFTEAGNKQFFWLYHLPAPGEG